MLGEAKPTILLDDCLQSSNKNWWAAEGYSSFLDAWRSQSYKKCLIIINILLSYQISWNTLEAFAYGWHCLIRNFALNTRLSCSIQYNL